MNLTLEMVLSLCLAATALAIVCTRDLLGLAVLLSAYSGLIAVLYSLLGAVDVAFTEVVVGAAISTGVLLALLRRVRAKITPPMRPRAVSQRPFGGQQWLALVVALAIAAVLIEGIHALPRFGDGSSPAQRHVAAVYTSRAEADMETPNVVTAVLADYRGFDTLIETSVVFVGALACLLVLRRERPSRQPRSEHATTA